jgi:hypothetical protein
MFIAILLLTLLTLGNIVLSLAAIGAVGTSQAVLLAETQHQARITRRALVDLLGPEEPTEQQKALAAIVNSPEFRRVVEDDALAGCADCGTAV